MVLPRAGWAHLGSRPLRARVGRPINKMPSIDRTFTDGSEAVTPLDANPTNIGYSTAAVAYTVNPGRIRTKR